MIPTAKQFASNVLLQGGDIAIHGTQESQFGLYNPIFRRPEAIDVLRDSFGDYLTNEEYNFIVSLRYPDGRLVCDIESYDSFLEIVNMIRDEIMSQKNTDTTSTGPRRLDNILLRLRSMSTNIEDLVWQTPQMEKIKEKSDTEYQQMNEKAKSKGYKGRCVRKGCNSDSFQTYSYQLRSGDEGQADFAICNMCNINFRI